MSGRGCPPSSRDSCVEVHRAQDRVQRRWSGLDRAGEVVEVRSHTIYFNGRALKQGATGAGNFFDMETGEVFWVSGVKRDGTDRHWAGAGRVLVEAASVDEYLSLVGGTELDKSRFTVTHDIRDTDALEFVERENKAR